MIRTRSIVTRDLDGALMGAVVCHVDGRAHSIALDVANLHQALEQAAAVLESTYGPMPAPIRDRAAWLAAVTLDRRTPAQAKRMAVLISKIRPGAWLGVIALAGELQMSFKNVPRTMGRLVRLGYLVKRRDGQRTLYAATLPGGDT